MSVRPFTRVVVPLDFIIADRDDGGAVEAGGYRLIVAPPVRQCIDTGAKLAATGGKLLLLHATPSLADAALYGGPEGTWMPIDSIQDLDRRAIESSENVLEDLAKKFAAGVDAEVRAVPGTPTQVILDEAQRFQADVIILPTSGHGRARRFFLGSTADKVIRQSKCPVLVIPTHEHP